jgi:chromosome segregation ATPase
MTEKTPRGSSPYNPRQQSGYGTTAQQGQSSESPYDPTEMLNELNQELGKAKSEVQRENARIQSLTAAITALTKTAPEVDAIAAAYEKGYDAILQDQNALADYRDAQRRLVDCATQGIKDCLQQASAWVEKQITDAKQAKCAADNAVDQSSAAADEATSAVKSAQTAYDDLKSLLTRVQQKLKQVKDLQKSLQDQEKQGNTTAMYVYLTALSQQLDGAPQLLSTTAFRQQLQDAWTALAAAQKDLAEKTSQLKYDMTYQDNAGQYLQSVKDNKIRDLLRRAAGCADTEDPQQQQQSM